MGKHSTDNDDFMDLFGNNHSENESNRDWLANRVDSYCAQSREQVTLEKKYFIKGVEVDEVSQQLFDRVEKAKDNCISEESKRLFKKQVNYVNYTNDYKDYSFDECNIYETEDNVVNLFKCELHYEPNTVKYYKKRISLLRNLIHAIHAAKSSVYMLAGEGKQFLSDSFDINSAAFAFIKDMGFISCEDLGGGFTSLAEIEYYDLSNRIDVIDKILSRTFYYIKNNSETIDKRKNDFIAALKFLAAFKTKELAQVIVAKIKEMKVKFTVVMGPTLRCASMYGAANTLIEEMVLAGCFEKKYSENVFFYVAKFHNGTHMTSIDGRIAHIESPHVQPDEDRICLHINNYLTDNAISENCISWVKVIAEIDKLIINYFIDLIKDKGCVRIEAEGENCFFYADTAYAKRVVRFLEGVSRKLGDNSAFASELFINYEELRREKSDKDEIAMLPHNYAAEEFILPLAEEANARDIEYLADFFALKKEDICELIEA